MKNIIIALFFSVSGQAAVYACEEGEDTYKEYQYHLEPYEYERCSDIKEEYKVVVSKRCIYGDFATINGIPQHVESVLRTSPDGFCPFTVSKLINDKNSAGNNFIRSILLTLRDVKEDTETRERVVRQECRTVIEYPYVVRCGTLP